jgi:quercetin dioxygenase-like cupin family protein
MENMDIANEKTYISVEIIEYVPNNVVVKTILKKSSRNVSVVSADNDEGLTENTSPFDSYVQVVDGKIELVISGKLNMMQTGQSIIIPAYAPNYVKPSGRFKMIVTMIKNEFE